MEMDDTARKALQSNMRLNSFLQEFCEELFGGLELMQTVVNTIDCHPEYAEQAWMPRDEVVRVSEQITDLLRVVGLKSREMTLRASEILDDEEMKKEIESMGIVGFLLYANAKQMVEEIREEGEKVFNEMLDQRIGLIRNGNPAAKGAHGFN